jgi:hypothetical protein
LTDTSEKIKKTKPQRIARKRELTNEEKEELTRQKAEKKKRHAAIERTRSRRIINAMSTLKACVIDLGLEDVRNDKVSVLNATVSCIKGLRDEISEVQTQTVRFAAALQRSLSQPLVKKQALELTDVQNLGTRPVEATGNRHLQAPSEANT